MGFFCRCPATRRQPWAERHLEYRFLSLPAALSVSRNSRHQYFSPCRPEGDYFECASCGAFPIRPLFPSLSYIGLLFAVGSFRPRLCTCMFGMPQVAEIFVDGFSSPGDKRAVVGFVFFSHCAGYLLFTPLFLNPLGMFDGSGGLRSCCLFD